MALDAQSLYMIRLQLSLPRLIELGRRQRLPIRDVDTGYLVHCYHGELFGDLQLRPFSVAGEHGRSLDILAYTPHTATELKRHADNFADPWIHEGCEWSHFAQKQMPLEWPAGTHLGFSTRVCPIVRTGRETEFARKGAELDVYLSRAFSSAGDVDSGREEVYRDWLVEQVSRIGGVAITGVRMMSFRLAKVVRRSHGPDRTSSVSERPDVTMVGELVVEDSAGFLRLLRRGIGRHRAFGFGMVLLRPAAAA